MPAPAPSRNSRLSPSASRRRGGRAAPARPALPGLLLLPWLAAAGCDAIPVVDLRHQGPADLAPSTGPSRDLAEAAPSCSDGRQDGNETGIDCGGPDCAPCADRLGCRGDSDCQSGQCSGGRCVSCADGLLDGSESDIDCGGSRCGGCKDDQKCRDNGDCLSGYCAAGLTTPLCREPQSAVNFGKSASYLAGLLIQSMTVGDFDGDRLPDVAVLDVGQGKVSLLLGRGDGTLGAPVPRPLGPDGHGLAAGDLDGDGIDDLAIGSGSGTTIHLQLSARGNLSLRTDHPPRALAIADFDGDGHLDLGVGSMDVPRFAVYPGLGRGNFGPVVDTPLSVPGEQLTTGDLDGDGRADLVLNGGFGPTQVLLGRGDRSLQLMYVYRFPDGLGNRYAYGPVAMGRFDAGGARDVITSHLGDVLQPLLGDGKGGFKVPTARALTRSHPRALAVADFNRDGSDDLAVGCDQAQMVQVLVGDGKGGFSPMFEAQTSGAVLSLAAVDLNGDGRADLVGAISPDRMLVVLGK